MLGLVETAAAVNSLSLGESPGILVAGQTSGFLSVFKIGTDKDFLLDKVGEVKVCDKNIAKVVRTTRNDFALGTQTGVLFAVMRTDYNIRLTGEESLQGKDITELSEYAQDRFVVGLWSENDFLTIDR